MRRGLLSMVLMLGCSVIDPSLIRVDGGTTDTGTDASEDAVVDVGTDTGPTGLRKPPARPDIEDGPDTDPLTIALRDVTLNQSGLRWRDIGLDLDDLDTQTVSDPVGNGRTKFDFPAFTPTAAGDIVWTVTIADGDPDDDTATATTTVQ